MEIYTSNLDRMFKRIECKVEELNVESIIELLYYFYNPIGQNKKEFIYIIIPLQRVYL